MTFLKIRICCQTADCRNFRKEVNVVWIGARNVERFVAQWKGNRSFDTCPVCQKLGMLKKPRAPKA